MGFNHVLYQLSYSSINIGVAVSIHRTDYGFHNFDNGVSPPSVPTLSVPIVLVTFNACLPILLGGKVGLEPTSSRVTTMRSTIKLPTTSISRLGGIRTHTITVLSRARIPVPSRAVKSTLLCLLIY